MLYWSIILILFLICLTNKKIVFNNKEYYSTQEYALFIATIVFIIFATLRSDNVGADTKMYHNMYTNMSIFNNFQYARTDWRYGRVEIGYGLLEYIVSRKFPFQVFLMIAAIISIVPIAVAIYRYSENIFLSLFLYIAFGYFSFAMNGIRQAIAIGICFCAFLASREKKFIKFIILIAIATLFHKSALLFIPVYWLEKIPLNKKTIIIYVSALAGSFVFRNPLYRLLNRFSRQSFSENGSAGGIRMFLFMLFLVVLGWMCRNQSINRDNYFTQYIDADYEIDNNTSKLDSSLFTMFSISVLMWPIASLNAELFRMYYYYHIFIILYVPSLLKRFNRRYRLLLGGIIVAISCYYLQRYIIDGELLYSPYTFFWN